jgi:hypothetical protein
LPNLLGLELEGSLPQGEFFGREGPAGSLVLATPAPLRFQDVSVSWEGSPLLDRVSASIDYELAYSSAGFEARKVRLEATDASGRRLLHSASEVIAPLAETRLLNAAKLTLTGDLDGLSDQPVLAGAPRFTGGELETILELTHGEESTLRFSAGLRDAATVDGALPSARLDLEASGVTGEHLRLAMPVRFESEEFGASRVDFHGMLSKAPGDLYGFEASLSGERIALPDVQRLLALFQRTGVEAGTEVAAEGIAPLSAEQLSAIARLRTRRDEVPVWSDRINGRMTVDLGVLASPTLDVQDIRASLEVAPRAVVLSDLHASALGAELTSEARIDFDPKAPAPYALRFRTEVPEFDAGQAMLAAAPAETPTLEGRFSLLSSLRGSGRNPLDLALSTQGQVQLSGRDGVFRGLAAHAGTGSTAARVIGILTFSRELKAVARLLDGLGEIRFEDAELLLERSVPDRIKVSRLSVRSPQLRVDGVGDLSLAPARALLLSPMQLSVRLAAGGDMAILFDGMQLLEPEQGGTDYRELDRIVTLRGTMAEPDASEFWTLLEEGSENARGVFGVGLRALNRRLEAGASEAAASR